MSDVPHELGGEMTIPINEWLANGENTVSVKITPLETAKKIVAMGQQCEATISILVGKNSQPKSADIVINKLHYISAADKILNSPTNIIGSTTAGKYDSGNNFNASHDGDVEIDPMIIKSIKGKYGMGIQLEQKINLPLSLPKWKWLMSDKIANDEETKKELIKEYHKIWQALHDKNLQLIAPFFKERTTELAEAYYKSFEEMSPIPNLEKEIHNNQVIQGGDIPEEYAYLHIFGNGHLASITRWNGEAAIFFNYKDGGMHDNYDIIFRKQGDKWIITR
jgi:hypothetical protein